MKILFSALLEFDSPTAPMIHVGELANRFAKLNHSVDLVILGNFKYFNLDKRIRIFNASARKRNILQFIDRKFLKYFLYCLKQVLYYLFKKEKRPAYYEFLLKDLVRKRSYDLSYERYNKSNYSSILCSTKNIYTIIEINGISEYERRGRGIPEEIIRRGVNAEKIICAKVNLVVTVSDYIKEYYENKGIDETKIAVVLNGVNLELFRPLNREACRRQLALESRPLIGFVGSFRLFEGLEFMIQAMPLVIESIPKAKLIIIGSDWGMSPTREDLIAEAEKAGVLNNIEFRDPVPYKVSPIYINAFDVCFNLKYGGMPAGSPSIKLFNYLACGKPVICSRGTGSHYIVRNEMGILVDATNIEEVSEAIIKLLNDETLSEELGRNARRYAVDNCGWDSVAEKILSMVE